MSARKKSNIVPFILGLGAGFFGAKFMFSKSETVNGLEGMKKRRIREKREKQGIIYFEYSGDLPNWVLKIADDIADRNTKISDCWFEVENLSDREARNYILGKGAFIVN